MADSPKPPASGLSISYGSWEPSGGMYPLMLHSYGMFGLPIRDWPTTRLEMRRRRFEHWREDGSAFGRWEWEYAPREQERLRG